MVLTTLKTPEDSGQSIRIPLTTRTPLFTGGIGQYGEQIHPSGLLGSIRYFSCLVAAAIGDKEFIQQVWGSTGDSQAHAKQVAFRWETEGLTKVELPNVQIKRDDGKSSRWFFSCAQQGNLTLVLTKRGISDEHWNLLLIALRIQIRWASFGAKDQFGLGVLASDGIANAKALRNSHQPVNSLPGLQRSFFARVTFDRSESFDMANRLQDGLIWRAFLRGQFRQKGEDKLRHYLFGNIKGRDNYASAINISAAYPISNGQYEIRIWGTIPHTTSFPFQTQYMDIMQRLQNALEAAPAEFQGAKERIIEFSPEANKLLFWINDLAGVSDA